MKPLSQRGRTTYRLTATLLVTALALAATLPPARGWLEASMFTHLLVQMPLLMTSGVLLAGAVFHHGRARSASRWNVQGVTGLFFAALSLAFWMTPVALDHAVTSPDWDAAKALSLVAAGLALRASWPRARGVVQSFFVGNVAWMTIVIGMLYQELPQRLCNAYLPDDQSNTGIALVVLACGAGLFWIGRLAVQLHLDSSRATHIRGDPVHEI